MVDQPPDDDPRDLIPETRGWNGGAGIDPLRWIGHVGRIELAIAYARLFWPRFVPIDDHVLRDGATEANLRDWMAATRDDARASEAVINHQHIADIHPGDARPSEAQLRHPGRVPRRIHEVKLRSDFPDRTFVVPFNDEPGAEPDDYELTFWQVRA